MKKFFLTFALLIVIPLMASHIVGGEFELIHINGDLYRLNLIIYFDKLNGSKDAKDTAVVASIFRKADNAFLKDVKLPLTDELSVSYTQPECSNGEIQTNRLFYSTEILLTPQQFDDPEGYYVVWQRCCRNYQINNIYSANPRNDPSNYAGQTFYLEFPPVVKDGKPFINSSPGLFPPINDFACPDRPYYVDFAGTDNDGDSLYYSLVTPLNTVNSQSFPKKSPLPYPDVHWQRGFSLDHVMKGSPDLSITKEGLLKVTPTLQGLFVFAVKVEQFRDKIKIGESRRDFQMLVVDGCAPDSPPEIVGKKLTDPSFLNDTSMSVSFSNSVSDEDRCIQVRVSDPDSENPNEGRMEQIKIRVVGLNFTNKELSEILPDDVTGTLINGSTKEFRICFPRCPYFNGGPYEIGIIAMDDACSLPMLDTLRVKVRVDAPANTNPYFTTSLTTDSLLNEGDTLSWHFQIKDDDEDELVVSPITDGFLLADAGMDLKISQQKGLVNGVLKWNAYCDIYDFAKRTSFQVKIRVDDLDKCDANDPVFAVYNLRVTLPGNADPIIDTDLTTADNERTVTGLKRIISETLSFRVFGKDTIDHDSLVLKGNVNGFQWSDFASMSFAAPSGRTKVQSGFLWTVTCPDFMKLFDKKMDSLDFQFIVVDNANKCRVYKADTVNVIVNLFPQENTAPAITVSSLTTDVRLTDNQVEATLGQRIVLGLQGTDVDTWPLQDILELALIETEGRVPLEGFTFKPVQGKSPIQTQWVWTPTCAIFQDYASGHSTSQPYENDYTLSFRIADDRCFTATADTVKINMKVRDIDGSDANFNPPNFFSPNGDGINDYYSMEMRDADTGDFINVLPLDNCVAEFQHIRIYNRWGNQVFESRDRNFKWYGKGELAGVYFYIIKYTNKEYKGPVSIRY